MQRFCGWMPFLLATSAKDIHWNSCFFVHHQTPERRDIAQFHFCCQTSVPKLISKCSFLFCLYQKYVIIHVAIGLPDVPFLPGRPVFWPVCPASRRNLSRDAICPVFSMAGCGLHEITSWNSRKAINVVLNVLTKVYI